MKKLFSILLISISFCAAAQDTLKVKNLQLQAKTLELVAPSLMNAANDSLFQVYIDLRPKFRGNNPPTGTTLVTVDSIPTLELAAIYYRALASPESLNLGGQLKAQLTTARSTNTFLNKLLTDIEAEWTDRVTQARLSGRKILRGK